VTPRRTLAHRHKDSRSDVAISKPNPVQNSLLRHYQKHEARALIDCQFIVSPHGRGLKFQN